MSLIGELALAFFAIGGYSVPGFPQHRSNLQPLEFSQVRLRGELGDRYTAATCNVLTRTDRYPVSSFTANASGKPGALWWDWPGDQLGRWLSVLHVAQGYGWAESARERAAVLDSALPCQTDEGNFGVPGSADSDDVRIPSGNAFALRGLVDAYSDSKDVRVLEAARKLAGYFQRIAPRWETAEHGLLHEFYGHCLDGLVALYETDGDRQALGLAERIARHAGRTAHTHHSLSLCRGLVDLARVTGKEEYLAKVEDYLAWCRENESADGGLPEMMPQSGQDEGCGLADWIVVNLMMYQATASDRYVDDAERTLVNHFFFNQFHTGGFGHLGFSQEIIGGKKWQGWGGEFGSENPGCCSLWGQWALGQVGRYIVTTAGDRVNVNLYADSEVDLPRQG
ncbi:MAG TPA: beta-L-arabinofuranosidase domain-containing protein, partial [Fimbriimonadaceae bacterium]|nr:beta-L-arabinofuranosidase domain-containing protein [Fimbriimonadaceae bacterium]